MALVDEELGSGAAGDLDVLFREAHRRRRRRRLGMVAVAAGLVAWAVAAALGGPTQRAHPTARATRHPGAAHQLYNFASLEVVSPTVAWATEADRSATGTVLRSSDGGRTWQVVLNGSKHTAALFSIGGLTAAMASTAWVSVFVFVAGRRLEVDRTTDGGRTWRTAGLPRPTATPVVRGQ